MVGPRIALATLAVASFLVACGDAGDTTSSPPRSAANADAPTALQFSAPSVGGGIVDFSQFAGQTVVLWFWAPT